MPKILIYIPMGNNKNLKTKYSTDGLIETEYEPGSRGRVLKKRLHIRSIREINRLEAEALLTTQEHFYQVISKDTLFTSTLIKEIHRHFLGSLYEWAGEYRRTNLSKAGFSWPPAYLVGKHMEDFDRNILCQYTPCREDSKKMVAEAIAIVHAEFLLIHPFREGNGRIARLIADLMSLQAGYPPLDFAFKRRAKKEEYIEALLAGYKKDYKSLAELVKKAIERMERKLVKY